MFNTMSLLTGEQLPYKLPDNPAQHSNRSDVQYLNHYCSSNIHVLECFKICHYTEADEAVFMECNFYIVNVLSGSTIPVPTDDHLLFLCEVLTVQIILTNQFWKMKILLYSLVSW